MKKRPLKSAPSGGMPPVVVGIKLIAGNPSWNEACGELLVVLIVFLRCPE
jgi:hypothetical protein